MIEGVVSGTDCADRGIAVLLSRALVAACNAPAKRPEARSRAWVEAVCAALLEHERVAERLSPDSVRAFCRAKTDNRADFRLNELLYDILVVRTCSVPAAVANRSLVAVLHTLWAVESEFVRTDSRELLVDLNKLVIAQADNKLLVVSAGTPLVAWALRTMPLLLDPVASTVYLATVPHPQEWCKAPCDGVPGSVDLYRLMPTGVWHRHLATASCAFAPHLASRPAGRLPGSASIS